ncbi:apoptotic chromatin condensation inducer in the nucleus-like isoform X4 [Coregonus clupeaformis]|uniref:apoptotic chromatin condensation inducer in the nucleus-like isoform X4 n=1 Tax=Coregonus clupeaformis TaxID=59861 RepID=UPI001E1C70FD|nr:apoptotic chromatin condensation inducer in the nucleus-like isoform X4 [Coregonus clupeaformis]
MADEDVTLDGKPLQSLRVADLKAALEHRHLPKSGAKNALVKRLKGALMLENVKRTSTSHIGLQPNSQIGEEMSQNSFIKQYLAQQQELLRQRLEREAREAAEADAGETGPEEEEEEDEEEEEHTEQGNDSASYHPDKHRPMPSQPPLTRAEEEGGGEGGPMMMGMMSQVMGKGMMTRRPHFGPGSVPQESPDAPGGPGSWMQQRPSLRHEEPTTPSPPRAVASLSVRVLGDPERQGLPPSMPPRAQAQEKEGTAPADDDRPAHYVLHLSRSAQAAAGAGGNRVQEDSDEDDDSSEEDEDEWGPAAGARRGVGGGGRGGGRSPPPQPQEPSPSVPAGRERSRRKLQPPQHIPPQQVVHQPPMQLRQPTPPPSPPPELSFPLPDTPKQSPPDMAEEPERAGAGVAVRSPPGGLQRQDSDSSSRSSSPEPLAQRRPGPLSLLARKMASEGAFGKSGEGASDGHTGPGGESSGPGDGGSSIPGAGPGVGVVMFPGAAITHTGGSSAAHSGSVPVAEVPAPVAMFGSGAQSHPLSLVSGAAVPSMTLTAEPQGPSGETAQKRTEKEKKQVEKEKQEEKERESCLPPGKHRRDLMSLSASSQFGSGGSEVPAVNQGDSPKKSPFGRDEPLSSPPGSTTCLPAVAPKKPRMFSDTSSGSMTSPPKPGQEGSVVVTTPGGPPEPHGISVKPLKQGVLVSGAQQHTDNTIEVTSPNKASAEKPGGDDGKMEKERDSQAEKGTAKAGETRRRGPEEAVEVEPMGPVLPPSYLGKREEEKKRKEDERKKEEERCRQRKRASNRRSSPTSSGDSSSDSGSSSSRSSGSNSSQDKKKSGPGKGRQDEKRRLEKGGEKKQSSREEKQSSLSEPSGPGPMEVVERTDPEDSRAPQPTPEGDPENSEGRMEESTTLKALAARKISLTTGSKTSPEGAAAGEADSGTAAGRKRRWGSSTAVTAKKPSISITTDSLKSLIPDIKPSQEAVVDLHPDDIQLSGDEDTSSTTREDQGLDKDLKIRRTVTQVVVPGESQENGQGGREEEEEEKRERDRERTHKEKRKDSYSEDTMECQSSTTQDADTKKVTPSDTLVRRSISQQKSGVSVTIDDPVRTDKQPSPPRGKVSNIVHVCNLVRPFTLGQLKELLNRTGSVVEEGFWIDKIKSHCYVTYSSTEEAVATRAALHGVKWPQSNPKFLSVDFCEQNELDFHRGLLTVDPREEHRPQPAVGPGGPKVRPGGLPPLMPERDGRGDRGAVGGVRDQWAEREREMERRERTRAEREWDRDKVRDFGDKPGEVRERGRRSRSLDRERRRKERDGKERKTDKKEEPPAKLLDDLFSKTKAAPCIYWLPLTEEQANEREKEREERQKERERRRKEQQEEEDKKREEERKERIKSREEGGAAVSTGGGSVRGSEGDRDREGERGRDREGERGRDREGERGRDREGERGRDREGDKRKDSGGFKPRGPDAKPLSGFRRSRSNLRDRRR